MKTLICLLLAHELFLDMASQEKHISYIGKKDG